MKIILISGLSGAGKTVALNSLEDNGFFCMDNLPLDLFAHVIHHHGTQNLAIGIDMRSNLDPQALQTMQHDLRQAGHQVDILFLEANQDVLLRRFSETRRRHPLSKQHNTLIESLEHERLWLLPLRDMAYCIDTSHMNAQQLRRIIIHWLNLPHDHLLIGIESFGFKYGLIANADFVFDVRSLPNPYYNPTLRPYNGTQEPIKHYLAAQPLVNDMIGDIEHFLRRWLPHMKNENRSYVTIGIGCTGGQHRSVYVAEILGQQLRDSFQTLVRHRQLST